ncbi:nuclear transport factor 2 family protein [Croceicoccus bisphenolivorans]|uniref:nuclear transport factor 2 family protein n=1 Tax=Croceicoccus bisphenolivorans TaxID=1783232 RepID=UPI0008324784|nr:nuclear transport factor 2 family protein [Croceicoccus bisphenolivorans]
MTDHAKAAVIAVEDRRRAAVVAGDVKALEEIFADDLVHIHSTGLVHDKATLIAHIVARRQFVAIDRGPLDVRIIGDVAIITGPMTNHMTIEGQPRTMQGMVTQVLRLESSGWRFVNFQLTLES